MKNNLQILGKPCPLSNERRVQLLTIKEFIQSTDATVIFHELLLRTDTTELLFSKGDSEFAHFILHERSLFSLFLLL